MAALEVYHGGAGGSDGGAGGSDGGFDRMAALEARMASLEVENGELKKEVAAMKEALRKKNEQAPGRLRKLQRKMVLACRLELKTAVASMEMDKFVAELFEDVG